MNMDFMKNLSPNAFISIKKAAAALACDEKQLNALLDVEPLIFRHTGVGLARKLSAYDILEWRKRKESLALLLEHATEPHKAVIHHDPNHIKEKKMGTARQGIKPAPETIETGHGTFVSIGLVHRETGRSYATIESWIVKNPGLKIHQLPDPNVSGSRTYKYITIKAYDYIKKIAGERKTFVTRITRKAQEEDHDHRKISDAARLLNMPTNRIRKYLDQDVIKKYGTGAVLVSIPEIKAYEEKHPPAAPRGGRVAKATTGVHDDSEDMQTLAKVAKILGINVKRLWYVAREMKAIPVSDETPKRVSVKAVRTYFEGTGEMKAIEAKAETETEAETVIVTATQVPTEPAPIARRPMTGGNSNVDKEILLRALEHPDAQIANRVLNLLEACNV